MSSHAHQPDPEGDEENWCIATVSESLLEAEVAADAIEAVDLPVSVESVGQRSHEVLVPEASLAAARARLRELREGSSADADAYRARIRAVGMVEAARRMLETDDWEQALPVFRSAAELDPRCAQAHVGIAAILRRQAKTEAAHAALVQATSIDGHDRNAWVSLANLCLELHRYPDARVAFDKVIEIYPDDIRAFRGRGISFLGEWKLNSAVTSFTEALDIDPDDLGSRVHLGIARYRLGDLEQAVEIAEDVLEDQPAHLGAQLLLGRTLARLKRYSESEEILNQVLQSHKDHAEASCYLAWTLIEQGGRMDRAALLLEGAIARSPKLALAPMILARLFAADKDNPRRNPELAEELARQAVTLAPNNADAHHTLAEVLSAIGKRPEALSAAQEAARIAPEIPAYQETLKKLK